DFVGCNGGSDTVVVRVNPRPVVSINGPSSVCANGSGTYSVTSSAGVSYQWSVTGAGGTITSGAGTNSITVQWGAIGTGSISVTATSDSGCKASATFTTTIGTGLTPT